MPKASLVKLCQSKKNYVLLSHWDWDHIGLIKKSLTVLPNLCILTYPSGPTSYRKRRYLSAIPQCAQPTSPCYINEIDYNPAGNKIEANRYSRVYLLSNSVLIPADSYIKDESIWIKDVLSKRKIRLLAIGHHGSKTSTSDALITALPNLVQGIVSSRLKRYGHPHPTVTTRLKKHRVPMLRTETWGNIHFQITPERGDIPCSDL